MEAMAHFPIVFELSDFACLTPPWPPSMVDRFGPDVLKIILTHNAQNNKTDRQLAEAERQRREANAAELEARKIQQHADRAAASLAKSQASVGAAFRKKAECWNNYVRKWTETHKRPRGAPPKRPDIPYLGYDDGPELLEPPT